MAYVIDDDQEVRVALAGLLNSAGIRAQCFETAEAFFGTPPPNGPSCIVLDVNLPGINGLQFQKTLRGAGLQIPIIFLTAHGDIPMTVSAMKSGAVEFFTKPVDDDKLLQAVEQALARDREARRQDADRAEFRQRYDRLTTRERQVMDLVLSGLQNKEVAARLGTSVITIKVHRSRIMHKMRAASLLELARMAERLNGPSSVHAVQHSKTN